MTRRLSSLLWGCSVAATLSGCTGADPIQIGLVGPFSQDRGVSMRLGAEMAANEINRAGGIDGRQIDLVILDDSADAQAAIRAAQRLYDMPAVVAVIGHLTSGTTLAAAPIYNGGSSPLLEISPSASSPAVSAAGPYTFRVCPTDQVHGAQLADWARTRLGAERAAVLYQNDSYGRGVRRTFIESFVGQGGEVVQDDPFITELPSFVPFLRLLTLEGGADVLMVAGSQDGGARILSALDSVGLRVQVMGGDGLAGVQNATAAAEGVLISTAYLADQPGDANAAFVSSYRAAFGNRLPDHRGAGSYDAVHLLARALRAVGPDRERLRNYVSRIGTEYAPFVGVTGEIAFDASGDVPGKQVVIGVVTDGQLRTAITP